MGPHFCPGVPSAQFSCSERRSGSIFVISSPSAHNHIFYPITLLLPSEQASLLRAGTKCSH